MEESEYYTVEYKNPKTGDWSPATHMRYREFYKAKQRALMLKEEDMIGRSYRVILVEVKITTYPEI